MARPSYTLFNIGGLFNMRNKNLKVGDRVEITRKQSIWYKKRGTIILIDEQGLYHVLLDEKPYGVTRKSWFFKKNIKKGSE